MTTLTHPPRSLPFARGLSLRTWFKGLKLLAGLLSFTSLGALVLMFLGGSLDVSGALDALLEMDPATGRIPPPLVLAGLFFVGRALEHQVHRRVGHLERRGLELLQAGRPEAAIRDLEVAAACGSEAQRARSFHGLALAWLRLGDLERALSFGEATTGLWGRRTRGLLRTGAPATMALVLALDGELEQARTWVQAIERPLFDKTDHALLAQAVIFCREGLYVLAVKRIQRTALEHVPTLDVGAVGVIHAFARSRLGGQLVPLTPGCVMPHKPGRGSGYEYLGQAWPELAAFLRGEDGPAGAREA
jgi:tetratricopeptide (TPR) repeat protein